MSKKNKNNIRREMKIAIAFLVLGLIGLIYSYNTMNGIVYIISNFLCIAGGIINLYANASVIKKFLNKK